MYKYEEICKNDIYKIKDLWNKNKEFHKEKSQYFSCDYSSLIFEERMKRLFDNLDKIKITIVLDINETAIAYCLSTIKGQEGELATLHVEETHRKRGIAKNLIGMHIDWMKESHCKDIIVNVLNNNNSAIDLYKNAGFKEDLLKMKIETS